MTTTLCAYEGPKVEELPTEIADVVNAALKQLPESAKLIVQKVERKEFEKAEEDYHTSFDDFSAIYVSNLEDTDIVCALIILPAKKYSELVYLNQPVYRLQIGGELLPPGTLRKALGYDPSKLWTLERPGDKIEKHAIIGTADNWLEAVPREGQRYKTGERREKTVMR